MANTALHYKDVRELQRLAQTAPVTRPSPRRKPPSRAAMLELIDILSRWAATGIALLAGLGVYLAVTVGRDFPARAACWGIMMIAALWACRSLRSRFRSGRLNAGRPFHWRASYTSCLSVLGVIFASAPILLTPATAPAAVYLQVAAIVLIGGFAAAIAHAAHLPAAAAIAAPTAVLPLLSALRAGDPALVAAVLAISAMGLAVIYGLGRIIAADAARRNPRTSLLRKSASQASDYPAETASTAPAAGIL